MSDLKISLIQTHTHWHRPDLNRDLFDSYFKALPDAAQVVVLPEMFSTGFTMAAAEMAEPMDGPTISWMQERASALGKVLCGSLIIQDQGRFFNRLVWVSPEGVVTYYDKRHLFRMAKEDRYFSPGNQASVATLGEWRINLSVCYDLRFPVWLRNCSDYDLLLVVANWPGARALAWQTLLAARAIENQAYCVGLNIVGRDGAGVDYAGGSAVYGMQGDAVFDAHQEAGLFTVSLSLDDLREYRQKFPAHLDADRFCLE
ncbi:MAG: amidohydrolase [OM182 bacterium]|nr:MAG: amidohydrolase [OM182 bacterium]HBK19093.1 amidohydrolase [Gammaproteobacteria bacterium]|tara:strand:+ start:1467 stop:2240 length:774 start_codon:yes stop_codon:yes gene_type:complete